MDYQVSYEPETEQDRLHRNNLPRETINGTTYVVKEIGNVKKAEEEGLRKIRTDRHLFASSAQVFAP